MPKTEKDSFEYAIRRHSTFVKSTQSGQSFSYNKLTNKATRSLIFGINRKVDNENKTKQLKLF